MNSNNRSPFRASVAWGLIALTAFAVAFFSVAAPSAAAQTAAKGSVDSKRYSQLLQNIFQFILDNYVDELDAKKLYEGAMKGMFESVGDPYSTFLDEPMLSDLMGDADGVYAGVGLYISKEPGTESEGHPLYIEVVSPIEDTPAWREGIKPGDLILKIDGEDTSGLTVDQASAKIRGAAGSTVTLTFRRGTSFEFDVSFTRASIEIPAIKSALIPYGDAKIGYIRIIEWIPQTVDRMREAIAGMKAQGMTQLLIDVRSNPGGLLSSVVDVSDLFLDSGMIVSTRGRNKEENSEYKASPGLAVPGSLRMAVLTNKGSASASEIFAGAMKDNKRALLIGETTYGKGSVQQIFPLDTTGFKLTMARYYTPSGVNIDKTGISPDLVSTDFEFSDQAFAELERLYDSGQIKRFAEEHPDATAKMRNAFAKSLVASGYALPESYVERLVRDELNRTQPAPVYDLEFDAQLKTALDELVSPGFDEALEKSKTLSQSAQVSAGSSPAAH